MTSQQINLGESGEGQWQIDSHDNTVTTRSDIEVDESTDTVHQHASGDKEALDCFIQAHPLSSAPSGVRASNPHLACPVVIPQRRPGNKSRGFVAAYAPALEQFGIQKAEFIEFIEATNNAVRQSKWLNAIQLAAMGTSFVPNPIAIGASMAVQIVAGVIAKAETRWKTNSFLDRANEEYFKPRGLYCLLMAYTPITYGDQAPFNAEDAVSSTQKSVARKEHSLSKRARENLRDPVAGRIAGEQSLPSNVAPLVYSKESIATSENRKLAKGRNAITRINNYFDDRAQAKYAKESGGDELSQPSPPTFKNRYLDPTHPATNGGLLGLVSGGHLTPNTAKTKQRIQSSLDDQTKAMQTQQSIMMDSLHQQLALMHLTPEQEQVYIKQYNDAFQLQEQQLSQQAQLITSGAGTERSILNVSYLMIVEMPSDEQIATAHRTLEASDGRKFGHEASMKTVEI